MKCYLLHNKSIIAEIELYLTEVDIVVIGVDIKRIDLFPMALRRINTFVKEKQCDILTKWLRFRCISIDRFGFDDLFMDFYQFPKHTHGRLFGYQYTAAALSYFRSGFDDYIIMPMKAWNICYVYTDPDFLNFYRLAGYNDNIKFDNTNNPEINQLLKDGYINKLIPFKDYYNSSGLTIFSKYPSWWDGECLYQKIEHNNSINDFLKWLEVFNVEYSIDKNIIKYGNCSDDVCWLRDYAFISNSYDEIIENIKNDYPDVSSEKLRLYLKENNLFKYSLGFMNNKIILIA